MADRERRIEDVIGRVRSLCEVTEHYSTGHPLSYWLCALRSALNHLDGTPASPSSTETGGGRMPCPVHGEPLHVVYRCDKCPDGGPQSAPPSSVETGGADACLRCGERRDHPCHNQRMTIHPFMESSRCYCDRHYPLVGADGVFYEGQTAHTATGCYGPAEREKYAARVEQITGELRGDYMPVKTDAGLDGSPDPSGATCSCCGVRLSVKTAREQSACGLCGAPTSSPAEEPER